jgi:hypothetical protein
MSNKRHSRSALRISLRLPIPALMGAILAMIILLMVSLSAAGVQATSVMPKSYSKEMSLPANTIYLPLVLNIPHPLPVLVGPQNGAVLDTLIPLFQWDTSAQPANTSSCLAFSTGPHPTGCNASGFASSGPHQIVAWYNLSSSTTYFWRVGAVYNGDYDNPNWSEEWSFTTGPTGGTILPSPTLISPANGSSVPPNNPYPVLNWNAVAGAVEYSVTLHDMDRDYWYGIDTTTTQVTLSWPPLYPLTHYEWYVEARNNYAWGTSSVTWQFITTSGSTSLTSYGSGLDHVRMNPDGTYLDVNR